MKKIDKTEEIFKRDRTSSKSLHEFGGCVRRQKVRHGVTKLERNWGR
jgi:hypothetical protein